MLYWEVLALKVNDRRQDVFELLKASERTVSAADLALKCGVTRQVIVADIALLRASNIDIVSTNRGYILKANLPSKPRRVFKVSHDMTRTLDELNSIVDAGGRLLDVIVNHPVYGDLKADLNISNRRQVSIFMDKMDLDGNKPLSLLTDDYIHYHTVEADSEEDLDYIEEVLAKEGFLVVDR